MPGRQGTEHAIVGVVGQGGRFPVGDLPKAPGHDSGNGELVSRGAAALVAVSGTGRGGWSVLCWPGRFYGAGIKKLDFSLNCECQAEGQKTTMQKR